MTTDPEHSDTSRGPQIAADEQPSPPSTAVSRGRRVAKETSGGSLREYTAEAFFSIDAANASAARSAIEAAVDAIDALLAGRAHRDPGDERSRIQLCMESEGARYAVEEA